jgi:hypothetical protein
MTKLRGLDNSGSRGLRLDKKDIESPMSIRICTAGELLAPVFQNDRRIGELD